MFSGMYTIVIHMDQRSHQVWGDHLHQTLLAGGISYFWVLQECLASAQIKRMVGKISLGSRPTTVDGSLDVSTSFAFPMWAFIVDTSLRTLGSHKLCSCSCHKTVWGKAIHSSHYRLSLTGTWVRSTRTSSIAQSDVANLERTALNEIGPASWRLYSRVYCLEKTETWGCSSFSKQNASPNFGSCSYTTVRDRDYSSRVCFWNIGNGAEVSEAPRDSW